MPMHQSRGFSDETVNPYGWQFFLDPESKPFDRHLGPTIEEWSSLDLQCVFSIRAKPYFTSSPKDEVKVGFHEAHAAEFVRRPVCEHETLSMKLNVPLLLH